MTNHPFLFSASEDDILDLFGRIDELINSEERDNANLMRNPETQHKYTADAILKEYALQKLLSEEERTAHIKGYLHIHDLEFFPYRPLNCLQHNLRMVIEDGLMVDGTGRHTTAAGPAKHLETLMNHAGQLLGAGQINMSGGQSIPFFNSFIAPYVDGLSDREIRQALQSFIYNLNMSYVSRGGQTIFSTINVDLEMPEFLKDYPAVMAGEEVGVYGAFEDEAKRVVHLLVDVLSEGDYIGKPFLFPNTVFVLNDNVDFDEWIDVMELSAKFGTPYFSREIGDGYATLMGCRTRLGLTWTGKWEEDVIQTGNLGYITINLPRLALKGDSFYYNLERALEIAASILLKRREHALMLLESDMNPFLMQEYNGRPYYRIENATLSFGVCGLYECLQILGRERDWVFAEDVMRFINQFAQNMKKKTGLRWTIIASPAESTSYRFATMNLEDYGDKAHVRGCYPEIYYSNSTHLPVDSKEDIIKRLMVESRFHGLTMGGNIAHIFLGERGHPGAIGGLTRNIYNMGTVGFWAYTPIFTVCYDCGRASYSKPDACPMCGSRRVEHYDRVTGYLQKVSGWNDGKRGEFKDRRRFNLT